MPLPRKTPTILVRALSLLAAASLLAGAIILGLDWLERHPQHDPRAPLSIAQPEGWATKAKLAGLRDNPVACREVLERSDIAFEQLAPVGEAECRRTDRLLPATDRQRGLAFSPARADATCGVHAAVAWWLRHRVQPAATQLLQTRVERLVQLGTASCRRIGNAATGKWSEHATGNAIDISAIELADGRIISVLDDWNSDGPEGDFLRAARDGACDVFGTTLSPDYNAAHSDHLHLDQASRGTGGFCR